MSSPRTLVHKFGGTSVAGAERYRGVAHIVTSPAMKQARQGIVVSAMSKVTDSLLDLVRRARLRDDSYLTALEALVQRHVSTANELLPATEAARLGEVFARDGRDLADILRGVWLGRSASELTEELVSGYGEIWSAQLLAAYLASTGERAVWLDARNVLVVRPSELGPRVDWFESTSRTNAWLAANPADLVVITGFIASTPEGAPTTLKRNGSDFSGSIFGALLNAEEILIWTDVDGVLSEIGRAHV